MVAAGAGGADGGVAEDEAVAGGGEGREEEVGGGVADGLAVAEEVRVVLGVRARVVGSVLGFPAALSRNSRGKEEVVAFVSIFRKH